MTTYLPTRAAAEVIGAHPETLRQWCREGRLPADAIRRTQGGHYRFNPEACLQALGRESRTPPRPRPATTKSGLLGDVIRRQAERDGQS